VDWKTGTGSIGGPRRRPAVTFGGRIRPLRGDSEEEPWAKSGTDPIEPVDPVQSMGRPPTPRGARGRGGATLPCSTIRRAGAYPGSPTGNQAIGCPTFGGRARGALRARRAGSALGRWWTTRAGANRSWGLSGALGDELAPGQRPGLSSYYHPPRKNAQESLHLAPAAPTYHVGQAGGRRGAPARWAGVWDGWEEIKWGGWGVPGAACRPSF